MIVFFFSLFCFFFFCFSSFFFFNDTATTEIYTLSLHDALPISRVHCVPAVPRPSGCPCERARWRSEEHTSELQSLRHLVCRLLLEKKKRGLKNKNIEKADSEKTEKVVHVDAEIRNYEQQLLYFQKENNFLFFFFNDTATTEIYTLSLHDALPILSRSAWPTRSPSNRPTSSRTKSA